MTTKHRIFTTSVAKVYPYYIAKAEKKGRTKAEVDAIESPVLAPGEYLRERPLHEDPMRLVPIGNLAFGVGGYIHEVARSIQGVSPDPRPCPSAPWFRL